MSHVMNSSPNPDPTCPPSSSITLNTIPHARAWDDWLKILATILGVLVGVFTIQANTVNTIVQQTTLNAKLSEQVIGLQTDVTEIKRILMRAK